MSCYTSIVDEKSAIEVFGKKAIKKAIRFEENPHIIKVTHGYDAPCTSYFCHLVASEYGYGFYYGGIGVTREVSRNEYGNIMHNLGLRIAEERVMLDLPY